MAPPARRPQGGRPLGLAKLILAEPEPSYFPSVSGRVLRDLKVRVLLAFDGAGAASRAGREIGDAAVSETVVNG